MTGKAGDKGSGGSPSKPTSAKEDRERLARQLLGTLDPDVLDEHGYIPRTHHLIQAPRSSRKINFKDD